MKPTQQATVGDYRVWSGYAREIASYGGNVLRVAPVCHEDFEVVYIETPGGGTKFVATLGSDDWFHPDRTECWENMPTWVREALAGCQIDRG